MRINVVVFFSFTPFLDNRTKTSTDRLRFINIGCIFNNNTSDWIFIANKSPCIALAMSNLLRFMPDCWRHFAGHCSIVRKCNQG